MKTKIIAEPATYWHGDRDLLVQTIQGASMAEADMFKLQVFDTKYLGNRWKPKKRFYKINELSNIELKTTREIIEDYGLECVATVNTVSRVRDIHEAGIVNIKIASGQINPILLDEICKYGWKRLFVSTGMIDDAINLTLITPNFPDIDELIIFHCVSLYPVYDCEINMRRFISLQKLYWTHKNVHFGYSDHSLDDISAVGAMFLGAEYVEKHFCMPTSAGPTCSIASNIAELKNLVAASRRISVILGDGKLIMQDREKASYEHYKDRWLLVNQLNSKGG